MGLEDVHVIDDIVCFSYVSFNLNAALKMVLSCRLVAWHANWLGIALLCFTIAQSLA